MKIFRLSLFIALICALNLSTANAAPTITATQDDATLATTRKAVGDTITYTTTISNTAAVIVGSPANDATGVMLTNPTPTNTTDAGTVSISPVAFDDVYPVNIVANIGINSAGVYNVFGNDYLGTPLARSDASLRGVSRADGGAVSARAMGGGGGWLALTLNIRRGLSSDAFGHRLFPLELHFA